MEEIRRSPVEVGSLSHSLHGCIHPRWLFGISSSNSTNHLPPKKNKVQLSQQQISEDRSPPNVD